MPMTKAQRRDHKAFLRNRRKIREAWTYEGPRRSVFGDFLRKLMGWK